MVLVGDVVALGKHLCRDPALSMPPRSFQDLYLKLRPHNQHPHLHLIYVLYHKILDLLQNSL